MTRTRVQRILIRTLVPFGIIAVLAILWALGLLATVVPIGSAPTLSAVMDGGTAFDRVKYVDSIWSSKVIPTVEEKAIDLDTLIPALETNPEAAAKQFGNDVGGASNFLVRFTGTVSGIDTTSLTGTVTIDAAFQGGSLPVKIQIGPIILGTALRDAVRFITFEQFTNQMQYGGVSDELNDRVSKDVIARLDVKGLLGKTLSVEGAFTHDGMSVRDLLVTPVLVKVE